jgi:hypothetical protein
LFYEFEFGDTVLTLEGFASEAVNACVASVVLVAEGNRVGMRGSFPHACPVSGVVYFCWCGPVAEVATQSAA